MPACPLTHYVVVRSDVPFGALAAQVVHAAGESSPGSLPEGTFAVVLDAKTEAALLLLEQRLISKNIPHVAVREDDVPFSGQLMAIGIVPCDRSLVKKEVRALPLLK